MVGQCVQDVIPKDARFILVVFDQETGLSEFVTDARADICDLILSNIVEKRRRVN